MSLRIATFNIENLMSRFDFSGFRNQLKQDRVLRLFEVRSEAEYQRLEEARTIAHTDDTRQLSALAIAECDADILCLQEVDDMAGLQAFEYGYLFKMVGNGYRRKYLIEGNDTRGIDVAVLMREETRDGEPIVCTNVRSHAALTYADLDLHTPALAALSLLPSDRIFKRDCLELDITVGGRPFTLYVVHFKSMGPARDGLDGRSATMPVRRAEALAVRRIIEDRFGAGGGQGAFIIAGDMNDYQDRIDVTGDRRGGYAFQPRAESESALDVFSHDGFAENIVRRRPEIDRWTLFHSRGPQERHLCQLDYLWLSQALAKGNPDAVPEIIRQGQPFRTLFPPGQAVDRFPRTGWDRPKASDHCPVVATLDF